MGADLPPRAARPDLDLESAAPVPCSARVRAVLQPAPAAPGHRERPATARTALTHPIDARRRSPPRTETRPPRRRPPRAPTCCLTCADEIFVTHRTAAPARSAR